MDRQRVVTCAVIGLIVVVVLTVLLLIVSPNLIQMVTPPTLTPSVDFSQPTNIELTATAVVEKNNILETLIAATRTAQP
mgnify:CR=1 FL=1